MMCASVRRRSWPHSNQAPIGHCRGLRPGSRKISSAACFFLDVAAEKIVSSRSSKDHGHTNSKRAACILVGRIDQLRAVLPTSPSRGDYRRHYIHRHCHSRYFLRRHCHYGEDLERDWRRRLASGARWGWRLWLPDRPSGRSGHLFPAMVIQFGSDLKLLVGRWVHI